MSEQYLDISGPHTIKRWSKFLWAWQSFDKGSFRAVAIIGAQGSGKTSLATNILLRRAYAILQHNKSVDIPVDPRDDAFNPFAHETITFNNEKIDMWKLSVSIALKYRVLSPHDLLPLVMGTTEPTPFGLIIDEAPLWSRDVISWWAEKKKNEKKSEASKLAVEFARRFTVVVRSLTTYLMVLSHTLNLIPSPIRVPIDVIIEAERFRKIAWYGDVLKGQVLGSVKVRFTKGMRTPKTESAYYTISYFALDVYMPHYLLEYDLKMKRERGLMEFFSYSSTLKRQRTVLAKFAAAIAEGRVEVTALDAKKALISIKDYKGVTPLAILSSWIRQTFPNIVNKISVSEDQTQVEIQCNDIVKDCASELVKALTEFASNVKK